MDADNRFLTTDELASRIRVKPQTLRAWRVTGRGPAYYRLGGRVAYRIADVEAWEAAGRRDPEGRGGDE